MDFATGISIIALLIAILSAVYARWSAREAKQANRISTHQHKLEILNSFNQFCTALATHSENFDKEYFNSLMYASYRVKLYFKKATVSDFALYSDTAHDLIILRNRIAGNQENDLPIPQAKFDEMYQKLDLCRQLEPDLLKKLESEVQVRDIG